MFWSSLKEIPRCVYASINVLCNFWPITTTPNLAIFSNRMGWSNPFFISSNFQNGRMQCWWLLCYTSACGHYLEDKMANILPITGILPYTYVYKYVPYTEWQIPLTPPQAVFFWMFLTFMLPFLKINLTQVFYSLKTKFATERDWSAQMWR